MFADERRAKIAEMIRQNNSVSTSELTEIFQVSLETVRRDLESMEKEGMLRRVHGGAMSAGKIQKYHDLSKRSTDHQAGKRELSLAACAYINNGDYIALDEGTTALELAKLIRERFQGLTVLTNSLDIFEVLSGNREIRVILTGGFYLPEEKSFYGHPAVDMIGQFHVAKYFITPSAISLNFGISDHIHEMIGVQRAMLEIADEIFVLVDSSKFETCAPIKICGLDSRYTYLTDTDLSEEIFEAYREAGIRIKKFKDH